MACYGGCEKDSDYVILLLVYLLWSMAKHNSYLKDYSDDDDGSNHQYAPEQMRLQARVKNMTSCLR